MGSFSYSALHESYYSRSTVIKAELARPDGISSSSLPAIIERRPTGHVDLRGSRDINQMPSSTQARRRRRLVTGQFKRNYTTFGGLA